jgi:hypothetical protein
MNLTTAPQRGIFASVATIRTLTKLLAGSVALLFAITASAQPTPTPGPWTWTNVKLNDATTGDPSGTVTGSFTIVPSGPFFTLTGSTTTTGADGTTFDSGTVGPGGFILLRSADGPDYTGAPMFVLETIEPAVPGGRTFETTVFDLDATPSDGSADIAFSVSEGTARILGAFQITCSNADCNEFTVGDVVDYDSVPPPTIVGPAISNFQYSLNGGAYTALSPANAVSPITISGLTNGTTYSITLQPLDSAGDPVGPPSAPVEVTFRWAVDCSQNSYIFTTQAQVDAVLQDCDSVVGGLTVGANGASTDITNLNGLSNLTSVGGDLYIYNNDVLANLDGLESLTSVGGELDISGNGLLTNLNGLANITSVGGDLRIINNNALTNFDGLANLSSVGDGLYIRSNDVLTNIGGLANLTSVEDDLIIYNNDALTNIDGLDNLASVGGYLYIDDNDALTNLGGLANLPSVGGYLRITDNYALTNIDGLANLTNVGGYLGIEDNHALTNCQGLAPVLGWPSGPPDDSVGGEITIGANSGTECDSIEAILASVSGPSQPIISTATGGDQSISLGFSPSTTPDDLFPITGYEAVCSGLTEIEAAMGVSSPVSVGNLTNYREYDCTVAPVTGLGTLPLSSSVSATPSPEPQVPIAPLITGIEAGNAQVSISVSVADDGGSPITGYTAYCFGDMFSFGSSPASPITVSGLTNGEAYECLVTATNAVGTSLISESSAPVTPVAPPPGC